jgi:hypothetical protein
MRGSVVIACLLLASPAIAAPRGKARKKTASPAAAVAAAAAAAAPAPGPSVVVLEIVERPKGDYEAEVYSGVPLDGRYARERGLDKGLVYLVLEGQRRASFRVPRERIRRVVRLAVREAKETIALVRQAPLLAVSARPGAADRLDVVEAEDGTYVVETTTRSAGIFTTSDVYAFPKGASLEQKVAVLRRVAPGARERIARALAAAAR